MRLIDADALIKKIEERCDKYGVLDFTRWDEATEILRDIKSAPTIEAEDVRHGKNIFNLAKGHVEFKCSLCGATLNVAEGGDLDGGYFKYCPNCGARMVNYERD